MDLLIQHARLDGRTCDILIEDGRFARIEAEIIPETLPPSVQRLDATGQAILPSFANTHCHAAMVLLRGLGDDTPLHEWLNNIIWPIEARLTPDQIYWGTLYGCLEMIRSGITSFLDMYWQIPQCMRAAYESGIRATVCAPQISMEKNLDVDDYRRRLEEEHELARSYPCRITYAVGVHAVYTTAPDIRRMARDYSERHGLLLHAHLSETKQENDDCLAAHGKTPTELFDDEGLLSERFIGAHGVWLTDADRSLLVDRHSSIAHCPASNCKLASGIFDEKAARQSGLVFGLGTDGASSNNRYDMFAEMRTAALLHNVHTMDPATANAADIYRTATRTGFTMLQQDAGEIAVGKSADCILVNLNDTGLVPDHNLVSNLVYAATPECVDTTICNGRILMRHRKIPGEDDIRTAFLDALKTLMA